MEALPVKGMNIVLMHMKKKFFFIIAIYLDDLVLWSSNAAVTSIITGIIAKLRINNINVWKYYVSKTPRKLDSPTATSKALSKGLSKLAREIGVIRTIDITNKAIANSHDLILDTFVFF